MATHSFHKSSNKNYLKSTLLSQGSSWVQVSQEDKSGTREQPINLFYITFIIRSVNLQKPTSGRVY